VGLTKLKVNRMEDKQMNKAYSGGFMYGMITGILIMVLVRIVLLWVL
jgi:hypothetical protein